MANVLAPVKTNGGTTIESGLSLAVETARKMKEGRKGNNTSRILLLTGFYCSFFLFLLCFILFSHRYGCGGSDFGRKAGKKNIFFLSLFSSSLHRSAS